MERPLPLVLVSSRLSDRISKTPEGYLLCQDVPIARTGVLEYAPDEVPISAPGNGGLVQVHRYAGDLFDPKAMASFEGKPVTDGHPDDDVSPDNWRDLARGVVQNVRAGADGLLLADLLITDSDAIAKVEGGLRELSCGYDAEYVELGPGVGWQTRLRGNHVALVEDGRCGPICAIRDARTKTRDARMTKKRGGLWQAIMGSTAVRRAVDADPKVRKALDAAIAEEVTGDPAPVPQPGQQPAPQAAPEQQAVTDEGEEGPSLADELGEIKLLLRTLVDRQPAATSTDEDPDLVTDDDGSELVGDEDPEDGDPKPAPAATTTDRRASADLVRDAAILAPGLAVATGDRRAVVQRLALRSGVRDAAVRRVVDAMTGGKGVDRISGATLDAAFAAAVEVARVGSNARTADALTTSPGSTRDRRTHDTPSSLNQTFAKHREALRKG